MVLLQSRDRLFVLQMRSVLLVLTIPVSARPDAAQRTTAAARAIPSSAFASTSATTLTIAVTAATAKHTASTATTSSALSKAW